MRIRTFEALTGKKLNVEAGDPGGPFRFTLETLVGQSVLLTPVDKRSSTFARDVDRGLDIELVGFVEDGILRSNTRVDRWSERNGTLYVARPSSVTFSQRRRTVRLPARREIELAVLRDGELRTVKGQTVNISIGGFAANVQENFTKGEELMVVMRLPTAEVFIVAEVTMMESLRQRVVHARTTSITPTDYDTLLEELVAIEKDLARIGVHL